MQAEKEQREYFLTGKGIGYKKSIGETINEYQVEKKFELSKNKNVGIDLLNSLDPQYFKLVSDMIDIANKELGTQLSDTLFLSLLDHIGFSIKRHKEGIVLKNPLYWEVLRFYKEEVRISKLMLEYLNQHIDVHLEDEESTMIALHLVNSQNDISKMENTLKITSIANEIMDIVRYEYKRDFDEQDFRLNRFLIHLRYFVTRHVENIKVVSKQSVMYEMACKNYPTAEKCVSKISAYLSNQYGWSICTDEKLYILIHIENLTG